MVGNGSVLNPSILLLHAAGSYPSPTLHTRSFLPHITSSPSRCSHQMVYFKDKVYLFGGEYATLDQVHPYLHLLLLLYLLSPTHVLLPSTHVLWWPIPTVPPLPWPMDVGYEDLDLDTTHPFGWRSYSTVSWLFSFSPINTHQYYLWLSSSLCVLVPHHSPCTPSFSHHSYTIHPILSTPLPLSQSDLVIVWSSGVTISCYSVASMRHFVRCVFTMICMCILLMKNVGPTYPIDLMLLLHVHAVVCLFLSTTTTTHCMYTVDSGKQYHATDFLSQYAFLISICFSFLH